MGTFKENFEDKLLKIKGTDEYDKMLKRLSYATGGERIEILNKLEVIKRLEIKKQRAETAASLRDLAKALSSMKVELKLVEEFHNKFNIPILNKPTLISNERSNLRYKLIKEEIEEYKQGIQKNDLENIAKELTDILYATYGTIIEHGLQDKISDIFVEVHKSNMSKDYSKSKMIKGDKYFEPNIKNIINE